MSYIQKDHSHSQFPITAFSSHHTQATLYNDSSNKARTIYISTTSLSGKGERKTPTGFPIPHTCNPRNSAVCTPTKIAIWFTEHDFFSALNKARQQIVCLEEEEKIIIVTMLFVFVSPPGFVSSLTHDTLWMNLPQIVCSQKSEKQQGTARGSQPASASLQSGRPHTLSSPRAMASQSDPVEGSRGAARLWLVLLARSRTGGGGG